MSGLVLSYIWRYHAKDPEDTNRKVKEKIFVRQSLMPRVIIYTFQAKTDL